MNVTGAVSDIPFIVTATRSVPNPAGDLPFQHDDGIVVTEVRKGHVVETTYGKLRQSRPRRRKEGPMTTTEYLQTEETVLPRELAFGVLRVADSPVASHQRLLGRLHLALAPFVAERRLGEVLLAPMDVVLDYDRALVVQPDLMFVSAARGAIVSDRVYGAPDLVIEILSPHPRIGRLEERVGWFATYGVRECWLADLTARQYVILILDERGVVERRVLHAGEPAASGVLPGVVLPPFLF
jgi:Uma2 family endonuclease